MSGERDNDRLIGQTLRGVYLVQDKIAEGMTGAVYRAIHTALDAPFAVKVLRQDLHPDGAIVARFQREARALSRLRHPNVVAVTDFGQTDDGMLFVVMEYVNGRSLARVIEEEAPFAEPRAVRIGAQILSALADAHARQVLHGALCPKDVMIETRRDPPDSVKVLDFGVAGIQLGSMSGAPEAHIAMAYLSPEQRSGRDVDARADLFAVGVMLFQMLAGRLPQPGDTHLPRSASPDLDALVMRAMQPHPYERPESAAEMRDELLRCEIVRDASATDDDCGPTEVLPRTPGAPARDTPPAEESRAATPTPAPAGQAPSAGTRGAPAHPSRATRTRRSAPGAGAVSAAELAEIERRALPILGPVAPFLVSKAGSVAGSVEELCEIVASFIPSEKERNAFLAASGGTRAAPTAAARRTPVAWDPAVLERAQRALASYIGPVARVVVRRASAMARDPEHLVEVLAREIPDEQDRLAFRREVERLDAR